MVLRSAGLALLFALGCSAAEFFGVPPVLEKTGAVETERIPLTALSPSKTYTLLFSLESAAKLQPESRVEITLAQGSAVVAHKTLHLGDPDFYAPFHVSRAGRAELRIAASGIRDAQYSLRVNEWPTIRRRSIAASNHAGRARIR